MMRPPTPHQIRLEAVRVRAAELVEVHMEKAVKWLRDEAGKEVGRIIADEGLRGLYGFKLRDADGISPDARQAIKAQMTQLLTEIAFRATSLEPNGRQTGEARKELEIRAGKEKPCPPSPSRPAAL